MLELCSVRLCQKCSSNSHETCANCPKLLSHSVRDSVDTTKLQLKPMVRTQFSAVNTEQITNANTIKSQLLAHNAYHKRRCLSPVCFDWIIDAATLLIKSISPSTAIKNEHSLVRDTPCFEIHLKFFVSILLCVLLLRTCNSNDVADTKAIKSSKIYMDFSYRRRPWARANCASVCVCEREKELGKLCAETSGLALRVHDAFLVSIGASKGASEHRMAHSSSGKW